MREVDRVLPADGEKTGVMLALENHWGLTTSVDTLLRIHSAVRSPWLGVNLDTGNFPGDPYAGIEKLATLATIVQAKTYHGGGEWYTLDLDYPRIAGILRKAGYRGWVSLEMEGKEDAATAVPKSDSQGRFLRATAKAVLAATPVTAAGGASHPPVQEEAGTQASEVRCTTLPLRIVPRGLARSVRG